jgi:SPP1 gp7 family putative phage head morphogenesis protein
MAGKFADSIDTSVDWDSPDEEFRKILKNNVWKFSVAKNHNDCIRLSNLLLDDDGKLRSWSEFKKEASKVVGDSNRYLKTEYNTIVGAAQMARLWKEIQRDKHIFPFVQFDVVMDGRTSDICSPLDKVIMAVDDPMLLIYFPPNHFNCRTTVRKLRNGVPTKNVNYPDIPEAFKNNVGANGEIFTNENAYIANTPKEVLAYSEKHAERWFKFYELQKDKDFTDVAFNMDNLAVKATHKEHNFNKHTGKYEKEVQDLFFNNGYEIILESESSKIPGKKFDGTLNGDSFDISSILGDGKNTIKNALNHSKSKRADIAILHFPDASKFSIIRLETGIKMYKGQSDFEFKQIIYIVNGKIYFVK